MSVNSLVVPVLVANIAVCYFLNVNRVKTYIVGVRGQRQINSFRIAGLMLILVGSALTAAYVVA